MKPVFLSLLSAAVLVGGFQLFSQAKDAKKPVIGIQLWSLRDSFKKDLPGTLDKIQKLGLTEVEVAGVQGRKPEEFRKMLDARNIKAISGHWPFERLEKEPQAVADEAKALGCSYVACAWVPHATADFTEADARKAIAVFNKAGEVMNGNGLKFCYHAHGYEFQPYGDGTLYDLMMKEMKPGVADFEMDVFWMVVPGQDPVALLKKYTTRYKLMHLKDRSKGRPKSMSGHAPNEESVACGTGEVDWKAVIAESEKIGIEHYFIEDEALTVEAQLPVTISYLQTVGFEAPKK